MSLICQERIRNMNILDFLLGDEIKLEEIINLMLLCQQKHKAS